MNISFFIPAYNCSATIAESVESILATNFSEGDELIIVNDFSTDNTLAVLEQLKIKYPIISIVSHKRNKGGAAARNTAVDNSINELLFCLDSDNVLEDNSIVRLRKYLLDKNADICSFEEMRYFNSEDKRDTNYVWKFLLETNLADFMADTRNPGSSGNYLFTKSSWLKAGGYPENAGALDTWGFGFKQLATGAKMVSMPNSFYYHRYGKESYYIRDMNSRNMSMAALQIILPHYNLFNEEDLDYIMSREGRVSWFENTGQKPIRLKESEKTGRQAIVVYNSKPKIKPSLTSLPRRIVTEIVKTIK